MVDLPRKPNARTCFGAGRTRSTIARSFMPARSARIRGWRISSSNKRRRWRRTGPGINPRKVARAPGLAIFPDLATGRYPSMHAETLKKLQDIGGFVLASGCTKKSLKQVAEMIRAARDYRFIAVYKIVKDEFVIMAGTGNEPSAYPRFPTSQGLCGAALESGKLIVVGDVSKDKRYLPAFHTTRSEIIVPMKNEHKHIVGMLDAESDKLNAFGDEDKQFLERAAGLIAHCLA